MIEWISLEDQLPECWDHVLLFRQDGHAFKIGCGYRVDRDDGANVWHFQGTTKHWPDNSFTHWQLLPKPPGAPK
jgi:hypothetical protein